MEPIYKTTNLKLIYKTTIKNMKTCKHKKIERIREYMSGDCYGYSIECEDCDLKIFGWSIKECEDKLKTNLLKTNQIT